MDARHVLAGMILVLAGCSATTSSNDDDKLQPDAGSDAMADGSSSRPPRPRDGGGRTPDGGASRPDASTDGEPGSACNCDDECVGDSDHPAICLGGVCMTQASTACSAAGSQDECADGSRCWGYGMTGASICWPDCDAHSCAGECDGDGSCVPTTETTCDNACCGLAVAPPACSPDEPTGVCEGDDQTCVDGECVDACSETNPEGYCPPSSSCVEGVCRSTSGCPSWMCSGSTCGDIVQMPGSFDPDSPEAEAAGYYIATDEPYSFVRRDLTLLVQYAACEVAARFPGTHPLGLSDLSQSDGRTPGTDVGDPRHPTTTHTGNDMDVAYYQTDGTNNPQIICGDGSDRNGNGRAGTYNDGYFCTVEENIIDWEREAYWFGKLAATPLVRVFGIDQTLVDDFQTHLGEAHDAGEISDDEYERALGLGYGAEGGWQFHHHHSHMSYSRP